MSTLVNITEQLQPNITNWETHAACRAVDNAFDLFFSEDISEISAAKRVCAECPVIAPCLEAALDNEEQWGVWGGQLFVNGELLSVKRRRGRPRKVARPEDLMPTIPIPIHLRDRAEQLAPQRRTAEQQQIPQRRTA